MVHSDGTIFFTDPPYGLEGGMTSKDKELDFSGVFRLDKDGKVTALIKNLAFPNGIALSPDEKTLYVAVSEKLKPHIMAFDTIQPLKWTLVTIAETSAVVGQR